MSHRSLRTCLLATAIWLATIAGAFCQCNSTAPLPANTVLGRLGIQSGPCQAIPFATLMVQTGATRNINTTSPLGGGGSLNHDLTLTSTMPSPSASTLGGVESLTCSTHNWFNSLSTGGIFGCTQPAFSDISGTIAGTQLPTPGASTLGGVNSKDCTSGGQFVQKINTDGSITCSTPSGGGNVSNSGTPTNHQVAGGGSAPRKSRASAPALRDKR